MPKTIDETVDLLQTKLRHKGGCVLTMRWSDFYKMCELERVKQPRLDRIFETARDKYGLLVSFGKNTVLVAHDRNFSDASSPPLG